MNSHSNSSDPQVHTQKIRQEMTDLIQHLRRDITLVKEPRAQALFETSAEVLQGLVTAFQHYEVGEEAAFKR